MLPVLETLRRQPEVRSVDFAGASEVADLFVAYGLARRGMSTEDLPLWRTCEGESLDALSTWNLCIGERALPLEDPRGLPFEVRVDDARSRPASRQLFDRFARAWCSRTGKRPDHDGRLRLGDASRTPARPHLWIHAGAGAARKLTPDLAHTLGGVARAWSARGARVTCSTGPADHAVREVLRHTPLPREVEHVSGVDVTTFARRLEGATAYLGHDTGPSHLAAALGVPSVVMFGPASYRDVWTPFGHGAVEVVSWCATRKLDASEIDEAIERVAPRRR